MSPQHYTCSRVSLGHTLSGNRWRPIGCATLLVDLFHAMPFCPSSGALAAGRSNSSSPGGAGGGGSGHGPVHGGTKRHVAAGGGEAAGEPYRWPNSAGGGGQAAAAASHGLRRCRQMRVGGVGIGQVSGALGGSRELASRCSRQESEGKERCCSGQDPWTGPLR